MIGVLIVGLIIAGIIILILICTFIANKKPCSLGWHEWIDIGNNLTTEENAFSAKWVRFNYDASDLICLNCGKITRHFSDIIREDHADFKIKSIKYREIVDREDVKLIGKLKQYKHGFSSGYCGD